MRSLAHREAGLDGEVMEDAGAEHERCVFVALMV